MTVFESRKNTVTLSNDNRVVKTFHDSGAFGTEVETLALLDGHYSPRLLKTDGNVVEMEYIDGDLLLDRYLAADEAQAKTLAEMLAETILYIYKKTDGRITFDENFRNYIVTDKCVRIDFEETATGSMADYVAKIAAFASLYEVDDKIKLAFIRALAYKTAVGGRGAVDKFNGELRFLADRWKVNFPKELSEKIEDILMKETYKRYIIGIDDTDDIASKGTGEIAGELITLIELMGYGKCGYITRHQLLIHPDIKYTSHNSSMIFEATCDSTRIDEMIDALSKHLQKESSPESDPGLCVFCPDEVADCTELIKYGYLAKNKVLTKESALYLAKKYDVTLLELGGDGCGVIGALAGVMLRYGENDGELKGGAKGFKSERTYPLTELMDSKYIDELVDVDGEIVDTAKSVYVEWKVKPVLTKGRLTVFLKKTENGYSALAKNEMRDLICQRSIITPCAHFLADVDEEKVSADENSCFNCTFRRWTNNSFTCEYKK